MIELPNRPPEACRVLLVEDHPRVLQFLADSLSRDGYQILTAPDGATALHLIENGAPDVVVLDVGLPDMDGIDLCQQIRAHHETRFLPVILVTGHTNQWRRGIEAGANEFLEKPVDTLALSVRVRALMRTKQLTDQVEENQRELQRRVDAATRDLREALNRVEALSKVKGNVLALISHEFRTPLHQAKLAMDIATSPGVNVDFRERALDDVIHALDELQHRIKDVEAFSDPTNINPTLASTRDLVHSAISTLKERSRDGLDRLHLHLADHLPLVEVDQARMTRVLAHLIENGVKFTDSAVDVIADRIDEGTLVMVRDYGPGLPKKIQAGVIDLFDQAVDISTRSKGGLGAGLALAKVTLEAHGIDLQIDSSPGAGTAVSFVLPDADV